MKKAKFCNFFLKRNCAEKNSHPRFTKRYFKLKLCIIYIAEMNNAPRKCLLMIF